MERGEGGGVGHSSYSDCARKENSSDMDDKSNSLEYLTAATKVDANTIPGKNMASKSNSVKQTLSLNDIVSFTRLAIARLITWTSSFVSLCVMVVNENGGIRRRRQRRDSRQ